MKKTGLLSLIFFCLGFLMYGQEYEEVEALISKHIDEGSQHMYSNRDSAYFHFKEADNLAKSVQSIEDRLWVLSYLVATSDYHFDLQKTTRILEQTDSILSLDSVINNLDGYEDYYLQYQVDQGNYYYKLGLFEQSKNNFLMVGKLYASRPKAELDIDEADALFRNNNFLGVIYKRMGKYELSESYYRENLILIDQNPSLLEYREAYRTSVNQLLAQLYVAINEPQKANKLFKSGLEVYKRFYERDKKFKNNLVNTYQGMTKNYIVQDSLKRALYYLDESQQFLLPEDPFYKRSLLIYGNIYAKLGKRERALEKYKKALENYKKYRQNRPHQDIAEVYGKMAEMHLNNADIGQGLNCIKNAMSMAINDTTKSVTRLINPNPEQVFSKRQWLRLLDTKAQLYYRAYQKNTNEKHLDSVLEINRDILKTFNLLKKEFDSKLDKQFLAENAYPIFHRMLDATYAAYQKNRSSEVLQLALGIAEENKDFLLLEALRSANATQYGLVPKRLLDKEIRYRAEITHLEKQQFDSSTENTDIWNTLFRKKQTYYDFLDSLKIKYPEYYNLRYGGKMADLASFRKTLLQNDGTLISYTMGDKFLYVIVVDRVKEAFLKLPFTASDREDVQAYYKLLSRPSISNNDNEISVLGEHLFEKILKEPLKDFKGINLTIVADDVLHYLPFDMLVCNGSYLLKEKAISYGNSLTSLLEVKKRDRSQNNRLLAFAPKFDKVSIQKTPEMQTRQLGKLTYNDDEVNGITDFFDVDVFLDDKATLNNFRSEANEANIIHLATHASANDEFPDYSYLAFSESNGSNEEQILYIKDLYDMDLDAEMITLSACQTGIGKLQKGQGMLSLSKGFYYAGAKSLVNTLWKINDKSTVKLMEYFYQELSEGKSKKQALRNAKLKYLETTEDELLKQPYYWSGFVVSGDTSPLSKNLSRLNYILGLLFISAISIVFFRLRRK